MDLLAEQAALQAEADEVLASLDLVTELSALGRPVRSGSSALGLMVRRDIDVTVVVPRLAMTPVAELGARLVRHERVRVVQIRDDTGHWNTDPNYPDGLYLGVKYRGGAESGGGAEPGGEWNLDIWFVDEPDRQPDLRHMREFPARLTEEARVAVLRIKREFPEYRSLELYEAVLDGGVRTVEEYLRWRENR